jgi:hypothetical protein
LKQIPTASSDSIFNDPESLTIDTREYLDLQYDRHFGVDWGIMSCVSHDRYPFDFAASYDLSALGLPSRVINREAVSGQWWGVEAAISKKLFDNQTLIIGVEWPSDSFHDSRAPLTICVAGNNPFMGEIGQSLRGRAVGGHPIELRRLRPQEESRTCHMIFVQAAETRAATKIFADLRGSSTLTVGEAAGFAARGGIINLTREENRLRFEVNVEAAAETRLKISSKLLSLAKIVKN